MTLIQRPLRWMIAGALLILLVPPAEASNPSYRSNGEMVFVATVGRPMLFGGITPPFIQGERNNVRAFLDETWFWTGRRWIQDFAPAPPGRATFEMVWDANDEQVILFGGVTTDNTLLADTWEYSEGAWSQIATPNAPSARRLHGMAYDPLRDRVVLFGGSDLTNNLTDTWEFDGTTWIRISESGPDVRNPELVWDGARHELLMIGLKADSATVMYRLVDGVWEAIVPEDLPECVSLTSMVWQEHNGNVLLFGGACFNGVASTKTWEWDGTNWIEITTTGSPGFLFGHAMAYDAAREQTILQGGTSGGLDRSTTWSYRDGRWRAEIAIFGPNGRSLPVFVADPEARASFLFGGLNADPDLWRFMNGSWAPVIVAGIPGDCPYPLGVWDSGRKRTVIVCQDSDVFEWNGQAWTEFASLSTKPPLRSLGSIAYDATLRKTVLYGGFSGFDYINETWLWDGVRWTKVDGEHPGYRSLAQMFYDPISKKTILYGGIGRERREGTLVRFADTWNFNGTRWVKMENVNSPPSRYGALIATDPNTGITHMVGGKNEHERFINEHWTWNGSRWTKLEPLRLPTPRMNGGMVWDPSTDRLTIFGGYAGTYHSDVWVFDGTTWMPLEDEGRRRRPVSLDRSGPAESDSSQIHGVRLGDF